MTGAYRFAITALGWYAFTLDGRTVAEAGGGPDGIAAVEIDIDTIDTVETDAEPGAGDVTPEHVGTEDGGPDSTARPYAAGGSGTTDLDVREVTVTLAAGRSYAIRFDYAADDPSQGFLLGAKLRLGWTPPRGVVSPQVIEAAELAAASDAAVVVVRSYEAEADDRPGLHLPNGQDALVAAVLAANPRCVVVLMTGSATDLTRWGREPAALLQAWFPGQAQGAALGRVLTGQAEPGGRLPLTLPAGLEQTPAADPRSYPGVGGRVEYLEGVLVGYRGIEPDGPQPAYPFGHGLSYTSFAYSDLQVDKGSGDVVATVTATVRNTGSREGSEVVQLYVGELPAPVTSPVKQLAAYAKASLRPGVAERVVLPIRRRAVSYFDTDSHDWKTPAGLVSIMVGSSSADIRLTGTITVDGESPAGDSCWTTRSVPPEHQV